VILVRLGSAKDRHYSVTLRLVDDALISSNGFSHHVQDRLKALHSDFWIAQTVDKFGGVANVSKQDR
jgi:hypothetical protein